MHLQEKILAIKNSMKNAAPREREQQPMTGGDVDAETEHIRQIELAMRLRDAERRQQREREMYMMAMQMMQY